ncbi:MAG: hypothetical protein HQ521_16785 [Bacteroidetes bacterium]|nr:hypothetical protein [Bacteroidota bacterium]
MMLSLVAFSFVAISCEDDSTDSYDGLEVASVATGPAIDGTGSDAVWAEGNDYKVNVGEGVEYANAFGVVEVTLTAVRTSTDFYLKAMWDDPSNTESVAKNEWSYDDGSWVKSGNEDRLFFFFDMGQNGSEGANCTAMCHNSETEKGMWTSVGKVDQWHWKAARSAPIHHADDKYIDNNYTDDSGNIVEDGGQHGDSKNTGLYNDNKLDGYPKYTGPLTNGFLILPEGSDADTYFTAFDLATTDTTTTYRGYWLNANADGSRADVTAYSSYDNGTWTVEFKRALNTENDDDVVFGSGEVEVTMAITDNAGGDHSGAAPFNIKF